MLDIALYISSKTSVRSCTKQNLLRLVSNLVLNTSGKTSFRSCTKHEFKSDLVLDMRSKTGAQQVLPNNVFRVDRTAETRI